MCECRKDNGAITNKGLLLRRQWLDRIKKVSEAVALNRMQEICDVECPRKERCTLDVNVQCPEGKF
jgi:hypothetical protein